MLRFFRTIRKKLIEQNNVRKYFIYATGEILLVVIGILIALQVNNWNEERMLIKDEQRYLTDLISDLQQDSTALHVLSIEAKKISESKSIILDVMDNQKTEPDSLFTHFENQWVAYNIFNPVTTTIDEMKSGDGLGVIRDTKLRRHLVSHYNFYENFKQEEQLFQNGTKEIFRLSRQHLKNINSASDNEIKVALQIPALANAIRTNFANGRLEAIDHALHRCTQILSEIRKYKNNH